MNKDKTVYKAFKTKIYPTNEQTIYFKRCFGVSRFVYNWFLNNKESNFNESWKNKEQQFMNYRNNNNWLLEVNSRVYRMAKDDLRCAYNNYCNKTHYKPKYKSKKNKNQSFSYDGRCKIFSDYIFYLPRSNTNNKGYKNNRIYITTSENILFLKNKQIYRCTISYDGIDYYVSFGYKEVQNELYNNHKHNIIGIDLGLKTFAVQSDGKISKLPKQKIIKIEKRIKKLNHIMSKKEYNSNNYNKVKTKLNKCYKKITNIKKDFLHKYTTWLCKNYKVIKIEDLNITSMLKNKRLAKSISRSNFYEFKSMLLYKSQWYNNEIILVDRWYASSKICNQCGNKKKSLKLSERIYTCEKCGYIEDRDLNAALNIRDWNK